MAARKAPMMGGSVVGDLTGAEDMPPDDMGAEDEFSAEAEQKAAFVDMCAAIRDGDDEAAWKAFQELRELGG